MRLVVSRTASPLGEIVTAHHGESLYGLAFGDRWDRLRADLCRRIPAASFVEDRGPDCCREAIAAYFHGYLDALDRLPVQLVGTPFQQRVWNQLRTIGPGVTASYGQLAARLGCPHAARAVGAANGSNPISLVVPCHRVIRGDGNLCGYGGGIERKQWLLAHESAQS